MLIRRIPMVIKRRGVEMRLVIEGGTPTAKADPVLVKAIARGIGWFQELAGGTSATITAIALREGVSDSHIAHHLPLAFLAPDIIAAILTGHHPVDLTADALFKRIDLPLDWQEQRHFWASADQVKVAGLSSGRRTCASGRSHSGSAKPRTGPPKRKTERKASGEEVDAAATPVSSPDLAGKTPRQPPLLQGRRLGLYL